MIMMTSYSRDSFDRFGDDLCEEILQYIPNQNKSTFACVSRQWMRTIYKRQSDLEFYYYYNHYHTKQDNKLIYKAIKNLLKNCSTVRSISLHFKLFNETLERKILREIADNCPNLTSLKLIRFASNYFANECRVSSDEESLSTCYRSLQYFGVTCGHRLTNADFSCYSEDKCRILLKHCYNLVSLERIYVNQLINEKRINDVYVPLLTEINQLIIGNGIELMDTFAMRYANTLKVLKMSMKDVRDNEKESECLLYLTELRKLEKLELKYECQTVAPDLVHNIKQIGINCSHLSYLSLELFQISNVSYKLIELFNSFGSFTELTHLTFMTNIYQTNFISSMQLKKCTKLTNISLRAHITPLFFINIHIYLPNIKILSVETTSTITDESMNFLSKLNRLKAIEIKNRLIDNSLITDEGVCDVIENCTQFKSFNFSPLPNITMKTFHKLIEIAINRPHITFRHYFLFYGSKRAKLLEEELSQQNYSKNLNIYSLDF